MDTRTTSQKGQALILIILGIVGLIGLVALAVDGGNAFLDRRNAQGAADAAALAAAYAKLSSLNYTTAGLTLANRNGYNNDGVHDTVTIVSPPGMGCNGASPYSGNSDYIQVIIRTSVDTFFAPVIGISQVHNCVDAITKAKPATRAPLFSGDSVVGLAPDQCDAIQFYGNSQTQIWNSGVFSNSSLNCGLRFNGNPQLQIFDAGVTMVASGYTINGNPQIQTKTGIHGGVAQVPYPPDETTLPVPNCTGNAEKTGSSMSPGNYTGTFPPSGVNTLNSGVYCIYGDFRVNAKEKLSGSGVTIFMMTGGITWNGKGQIKLSAPNSGPYAGLLFFSPLSNTNRMTINGDSDSLLSGTIFMPAAPIEFNGSGQIQKSDIQLIGYTVQLGGTSDTQINYTANSKYQIFVPASIEISQ